MAARLGTGLLVAAAVLSGVELLLRIVLGPPPPALRVFGVLGPDSAYWQRSGEDLLPLWASGGGEGEVGAVPCQPPEPQVLVLGGSSVHGGSEGVAATSEFPSIMCRRRGVQGWNLGYPGFDSHDLVRILEGFGDCRAETVVVYMGHNDLGNIHFHDRYGTVRAGLVVRAQSLLQRLQLYTQLSRALGPVQGRAHTGGDLGHMPDISPERRAAALSDLARNLERMAWLAETHDRSLVLVGAVSRLTDVPPDGRCVGEDCPSVRHAAGMALAGEDPEEAARLLRDAWDHSPYVLRATSEIHDLMARVAADHPSHLTYVDAEAGLPQHPDIAVPADELFTDGVHLSRAGHRALAGLLAPYLGQALQGPGRSKAPGDGPREPHPAGSR